MFLNCSHCPAKFSDQRERFRIAQHPRHLRVQHRRAAAECPLAGGAQQFRVRHAAPQEIREPRRQFVIAHRNRRLSRRRRLVALDAIEEIRRYQHRLQRRGDSFLERIALLARQRHISEVLLALRLAVGRTAERAPDETRQNRPRASIGVLSRSVPADEDPAQALRRRRRHLIERTADVDRLEAVVDARFDGVGLDLGAVLAQRLDVFLGELAARIDQRLGRPLGRLRAVVAGRQPVVVPQVCCREQVFAGGDPRRGIRRSGLPDRWRRPRTPGSACHR